MKYLILWEPDGRLIPATEDVTSDENFNYWGHTVAQGGEILVPGRPESPMQFIDARDLAAWVIKATKRQLSDPYITTGPDYTLTMEVILQTCRQISGTVADMLNWLQTRPADYMWRSRLRSELEKTLLAEWHNKL